MKMGAESWKMGKQEACKTLAVLSIFASLRRDRAGAEGEGGECGPDLSGPLSLLHSREPKRQKAGAVKNLAAVWTIVGDGLVAAPPPAWFPFACGFVANRVEY
jgi:hypothetical protein